MSTKDTQREVARWVALLAHLRTNCEGNERFPDEHRRDIREEDIPINP